MARMKVKTFQSGFPPCSRDRPIPVPHEAEPVFSIKPHHLKAMSVPQNLLPATPSHATMR